MASSRLQQSVGFAGKPEEEPLNLTPTEHMRDQPRWIRVALVPMLAGLLWLAAGWDAGVVMGVVATVPGCLLLASGTALLVWPGDRQISHYMALGAVLSLLPCLLAFFLVGILFAILLLLLGAASYLIAGYTALQQDVILEDVPTAQPSVRMAFKVAFDEALLGYFVAAAKIPTGAEVARDYKELRQIEKQLEANGWLDKSDTLHTAPAAPQNFQIEVRKAGGQQFRHLSFDSDYDPHPELPGRQRWLANLANRRVHAWVFRHEDRPRPWLLCLHGYRMGIPNIDFSLFDVELLHRQLGLNLIFPVLPMHGPRKYGLVSGNGYLDGALANVYHAQVQAIRDVRRALAWVHAQHEVPAVGTLGYSLGGYMSALLACLEPGLACAIAGIPLADMPGVLWRHNTGLHVRCFESHGITQDVFRHILAPVSPLVLEPCIAHDKRFIFAATGDQVVPTWQPLALWQHWDKPACQWYQGSHLSVRNEPQIKHFVEDALRGSSLCSPNAVAD